MTHRLCDVLAPIGEATAAIESAFLTAGRGLDGGLATFGALNTSLAALTSELDTGASATASASLARLAQAFRALGARLPADAAALADLVAGNQLITTRFGNLTDSMRTMTIVSRSARIEAVAFDHVSLGLEEFTRAIGRQIEGVQRDIAGCAAEHAKLTDLLGDAARTQAAFEASFHNRLMVLAGELADAATVVEGRRQAGSALIRDAAARSVQVTHAASMALVALQVGDSTRQRLEHVSAGVEAAVSLLERAHEADGATSVLVCRVQQAQLEDAVSGFSPEAHGILNALDVVAGQTRDLVATGAATYSQEPGGTENFIAGFRQRFVTALSFVEGCEEIRQKVEATMVDLRAMLGGLASTIGTLDATSRNLVLVGMNVGLKAARLGPEGRSLVVVAEELERLAGDISHQSRQLLPAFERVQTASWQFEQEPDSSHPAPGQLDEDFRRFMEELDRGEAKVSGLLRSLQDTGRSFEAELSGARRSFDNLVNMQDGLLDAAATLGEVADDAMASGRTGSAPGARTAGRVDAMLMPGYTMVRERMVHAGVTAALKSVDEEAEEMEAQAA